jgi:23S rRNA (guanosine2251-2'-O)-methyltransferase
MKRLVYGLNPVRELVSARPQAVSVVYLAPGAAGPGAKQLVDLCKNRRVSYEERERHELDALTGEAARHQGVVAITGEFVYAELADVLDQIDAGARPALLVVLDSVQDPQNLGAVIRSAQVLGAHAVVIGKDRAAPVTPAAVKASAGATEHLPVVRVTNVARAIDELKEHGLWTVAAVMSQEAPMPRDVDLKGPIALVLGAEGKGLRPLVERTCDLKVRIPMEGKVASLNVSAAAAILLYEAARQRS